MIVNNSSRLELSAKLLTDATVNFWGYRLMLCSEKRIILTVFNEKGDAKAPFYGKAASQAWLPVAIGGFNGKAETG